MFCVKIYDNERAEGDEHPEVEFHHFPFVPFEGLTIETPSQAYLITSISYDQVDKYFMLYADVFVND